MAVQFIIYYGGLGSFGHFQASKSGVHKGGLDQSIVKAGFVATRISVRWTDFLYSLFLDFYFLAFDFSNCVELFCTLANWVCEYGLNIFIEW